MYNTGCYAAEVRYATFKLILHNYMISVCRQNPCNAVQTDLVRLLHRIAAAIWYCQPILHISIRVYETPFGLPLVGSSVVNHLPGFIECLEPAAASVYLSQDQWA